MIFFNQLDFFLFEQRKCYGLIKLHVKIFWNHKIIVQFNLFSRNGSNFEFDWVLNMKVRYLNFFHIEEIRFCQIGFRKTSCLCYTAFTVNLYIINVSIPDILRYFRYRQDERKLMKMTPWRVGDSCYEIELASSMEKIFHLIVF